MASDGLQNPVGVWCVRMATGANTWNTWPLSETALGVGRGLGCHLRLDDSHVSRIQCELLLENDIPLIRNRSTRNPTLVNGKAFEYQMLQLGDIVEFAGYRLIVDYSRKDEMIPSEKSFVEHSDTTQLIDSSIYLCRELEVAPQELMQNFTSDILSLFVFLRSLGQCQTLDLLVEKLRIHLADHFKPDSCWIAWRLRSEGDIAFYPPISHLEMQSAPIHALHEVCRTGKGVLAAPDSTGSNVVLAAPLLQGGAPFGAIAIQRNAVRGVYVEVHLHYLLAVAESAAPMIRAVEHLEQLHRDEELRGLQQPAEKRMLGESKPMQNLRAHIRRTASARNNVLIIGETGVGKELAARMIHDSSPRRNGPYVVVNCAAIPENLFESELFGHERGAFTGAIHSRKGLFEQAHRGTLFLDEVGELSPANQARLLRVAETNAFRRVGGDKEIHVDVRILSATNRNLSDENETQFRRDLYYRLSGTLISVPPLRQRSEDIPELAHKFLKDCSVHAPSRPKSFSEDAMAQLKSYQWPGNIRELRNLIERACYDATGHFVTAIDLPSFIYESSTLQISSLKTLDAVECEYLENVLRMYNDNVANAAQGLGIPASTLYYKLRKHGIELRTKS